MTTQSRDSVFDRIVCGVDGSDAGVTAARVAGLVTDRSARSRSSR